MKIEQSSPFIIIIGIPGEETVQYYVCGEKIIICESVSVMDAVLDLICVYYTFDIAYPKSLSGIFLWFQHFVFDIKDQQVSPPCLIKLLKNIVSEQEHS